MKNMLLTTREVELITDRLGMRVDKIIRPAVIAFRSVGLFTSASCQGHLHRALPYPWVEFNDSQEQNKKSRFLVETVLNRFPDNDYLYLWDMGIYSGFRLQTFEATSFQHLSLLREEMNRFARFFRNR